MNRCGRCAKAFESAQALRQHLRSPAHQIRCRQCSKPFTSKGALQQHLKSSVHRHECRDCKKSFRAAKDLEQHLESLAHMLTYTFCDRNEEKSDCEDDQVNTARRLDGFHLSDNFNCPRSPVQPIGGRRLDGPNLTQVTQPASRDGPGTTVFGSVADGLDEDVAPSSSDLRLCEEQRVLVDLVLSRANVFFTGGAGTGKSTVLRAIVKELRNLGRHVEVVTPTGVAALNVGGTTYFTYAGWTPGVMRLVTIVAKPCNGSHYRDCVMNQDLRPGDGHTCETPTWAGLPKMPSTRRDT